MFVQVAVLILSLHESVFKFGLHYVVHDVAFSRKSVIIKWFIVFERAVYNKFHCLGVFKVGTHIVHESLRSNNGK